MMRPKGKPGVGQGKEQTLFRLLATILYFALSVITWEVLKKLFVGELEGVGHGAGLLRSAIPPAVLESAPEPVEEVCDLRVICTVYPSTFFPDAAAL